MATEQDQQIAEVAAALETDLRDVTGLVNLRLPVALRRLTGGFDTDT